MSQLSNRYVPPSGSENPKIYCVGEAPGKQEDEQLEPFVGKAGQLLRIGLAETEVTDDEVRFGNCVPFRPIYIDENGIDQNRTPTEEEIDAHRKDVQNDILKTNPDVILCLGKTALKAFYPNYNGSVKAAIRNDSFDFNAIPIQVCYHPSYIERKGGKSAKEYKTEFIPAIKKAIRIYDKDRFSEKKKVKFEYFFLDKIDEFLSKFEDAEFIGFDYETNTVEALSENLEIAGIGLARENYAAYLCIKDFFNLEYNFPDNAREKIAKFLINAQKRGLVVFNLKFECSVSLNALGIELHEVKDVMQYMKPLNLSGGLKDVSRIVLTEPQWTKDLDEWLETFNNILYHFKKRKSKGSFLPRREEVIIREEGVIGVLKYLQSKGEKKNKRETEILQGILRVVKIASQFCENNTIILKNIETIIIQHIDNENFEALYSEVPYQIAGKYCCDDSYNTRRIFFSLMTQLKKKDLVKAAEYYNEHGYLAYELEKNGIGWDDNYAEQCHEQYNSVALDSLKKLLTLPHVMEKLHIKSTDEVEILSCNDLKILKDNYFNPLATDAKNRMVLEKFLITKRFKFALMMEKIRSFSESEEELGVTKKQYPLLFAMHQKIKDAEKQDRLKVLDQFRKKLDQLYKDNHFQHDEIKIINKFNQWTLMSMNEEATSELYDAITKQMGVDINNQGTWTQEMSTLFYYKLFKKVMKAKSTYIFGKPGRVAVKVVDRKTIQEKPFARRIKKFNLEKPGIEQVNENQIFIFNPPYFANSVVTKRWSSGAHCLSGDVEILLSDGSSKTIQEIYNNVTPCNVFTVNKDNKIIKDDVLEVRISHYTNELIELELENGYKIKCTANHRFLLKSGVYKEAQFLSVEDELYECPKYYIYRVYDSINNKNYIGATKNPKQREIDHRGYGKFSSIPKDIDRSGLEFIVIDFATDKEEALDKEASYIVKYDSIKRGYNKAERGNVPKRWKMSEKGKKNISESKKGNKNPMYGKKTKDDVKKKLSKIHKRLGTVPPSFKNKKHKEETKLKIRDANTKLTDEEVRAMRRIRKEQNISYREIGEMFGVSRTTARHAITGYEYGWVV